MKFLELLAPARNMDIGIAAIDCGADAVYIAGPACGARQAAGNSLDDIRRLCEYAHRFGARIFLTLNTILFDDELDEAERLLAGAKAAGVDAIIAQDLAVWKLTDLPVHASTQCAIRTPEKARLYEGIGASRLVLEGRCPWNRSRPYARRWIANWSSSCTEPSASATADNAICLNESPGGAQTEGNASRLAGRSTTLWTVTGTFW